MLSLLARTSWCSLTRLMYMSSSVFMTYWLPSHLWVNQRSSTRDFSVRLAYVSMKDS